eukprot:TRINITY_DN854_c0_g1_i1.p1 TRINITY_DN854_c0_g1~~TRINITY_DN854_c0_g1_i1.p1  ORF type:complete len:422 (+),score=98.68 TRINITY_DN854_c0_g1_i1:70-1335(+)
MTKVLVLLFILFTIVEAKELEEWKVALIATFGTIIFIVLHIPCGIVIWRKCIRKPQTDLEAQDVSLSHITLIKPDEVTLGATLGKGHFGEVKKGKWNATEVAVKKVSRETRLDEEARILSEINHPHIVRIYGVFPKLDHIVMEYCNLGSLREFLNQGGFTPAEKKKMCIDVTKGMQYVASRGIVHRDLAARNVLVCGTRERFELKISDFGMSREGDSYYSDTTTIPYRWCAPEVFTHQKFSVASDVWSFGVTCWEIYELGKVPYHKLSNAEVQEAVLKGTRLECPDDCDDDTWKVMASCWFEEPKKRPNFNEILDSLDKDNQSRKNTEYEKTPQDDYSKSPSEKGENYSISPSNKDDSSDDSSSSSSDSNGDYQTTPAKNVDDYQTTPAKNVDDYSITPGQTLDKSKSNTEGDYSSTPYSP